MAEPKMPIEQAISYCAAGKSERYAVTRPLADRFWEKVAKAGDAECWAWTGATDGRDRGQMNIRGHIVKAPRISWFITYGAMPSDCVCHSCDNPICVNPAHLWVGSIGENVRDAVAKGRARGQSQTHCRNGHEFTPENTYWRPTGGKSRDCRKCISARGASYRRRNSR